MKTMNDISLRLRNETMGHLYGAVERLIDEAQKAGVPLKKVDEWVTEIIEDALEDCEFAEEEARCNRHS